jgi:prepilin-type N-terminal cleavage/methylation domain-containing protein
MHFFWNKLYKKSRTYGFTLIELLIVLAIVTFLTSVFFPTMMEARAKAEDGRRMTSAKSIQTEIANQTNVGSLTYTTVFTDPNSDTKKKIDKLASDTGLVIRTNFATGSPQTTANTQIDAYADATSFVVIIPLKTDPNQYWCVDAEGVSKKVSGRLNTTTQGPKNCNDATVASGSSPNVIATINTGSGSHFSVAVGSKVYVSNYNANTVSVINTSTDTVIATIPVGSQPYTLTAVGSYVYVNNSGTNTVSVINTTTDTISTTVTVGFMPVWSVVVGTKLYVSDTSGISVINTTTNTYDSWIYASSSGSMTIVGSKIYIPETDQFNPGLHVLDTTLGSITNFIGLASAPRSATLSGSKLFVNLNSTNQVAVINTTTETFSTNIPVGTSPVYSVLVGGALYVNNQTGGTVSVIDANTNAVTSTLTVGNNNQYSTALSNKIYTNNNASGTVSVVDTSSNTVTSTITVGSNPSYSTAVGTKLYVSNYSSGTVSVIQTN